MNKIYYYDNKDSMEQFFELNKKNRNKMQNLKSNKLNTIDIAQLIRHTEKFSSGSIQ